MTPIAVGIALYWSVALYFYGRYSYLMGAKKLAHWTVYAVAAPCSAVWPLMAIAAMLKYGFGNNPKADQ